MLPFSLLFWMFCWNLASLWLVLHTRAQRFELAADNADDLNSVHRRLVLLRRMAWGVVGAIVATLAITLVLEFRRLAQLQLSYHEVPDPTETSAEYYVARDLAMLAVVVLPVPFWAVASIARKLGKTTRQLRALSST